MTKGNKAETTEGNKAETTKGNKVETTNQPPLLRREEEFGFYHFDYFDFSQTLEDVSTDVSSFISARQWNANYDLRNLTLALISEIGQLSGILRFHGDVDDQIDDNTRTSLAMEISDCLIFLIQIANLCQIPTQNLLPENENRDVAKHSLQHSRIDRMYECKHQVTNGHQAILSMLSQNLNQDICILYAVTSPTHLHGIHFIALVHFFQMSGNFFAVRLRSTNGPHTLVKIDPAWFQPKEIGWDFMSQENVVHSRNFHPVPYNEILPIMTRSEEYKDALLRGGADRIYALQIQTFLRESTSQPSHGDGVVNPYQLSRAITKDTVDNNNFVITYDIVQAMKKRNITAVNDIECPSLPHPCISQEL